MHCLLCNQELPESFLEEWARSAQASSGRFSCPHCAADHVRREIGRTPLGKPQYSVRLWGHLSEIRRRKETDRRKKEPPRS
jgi:hypothetical protein